MQPRNESDLRKNAQNGVLHSPEYYVQIRNEIWTDLCAAPLKWKPLQIPKVKDLEIILEYLKLWLFDHKHWKTYSIFIRTHNSKSKQKSKPNYPDSIPHTNPT